MSALIAQVNQQLAELIGSSSEHSRWLRSIDERLKVLNGTVAAHEKRIASLEGDMKAHVAAGVASREAESKVRQNTNQWLQPLIISAGKFIIYAILLLLLAHSPLGKELLLP